MKTTERIRAFFCGLLFVSALIACASAVEPQIATRANRTLADYFAREVAAIDSHPLAEPTSLEQWETTRTAMKRQLAEMLGLDPMPERTPLNVVKTGEVKGDGFIVEIGRASCRERVCVPV